MSRAPTFFRRGRLATAALGVAAALALLGEVRAVHAAPGPAPAASNAASAPPGESPDYQRHLDAGIKLYEAGQLDPALREFEQAYSLSPQPAPLVNMALCYARLDSPEHPHPTAIPMAIAKLEQVLSAYGPSLTPERRAPVESKLRDLTPLVGELKITVEPPQARVLVGSVPQEPSILGQPIRVRSGTWEVRAELEGYTPAKAAALVTSGATTVVKLRLEPATGELEVSPRAADTYVEIDKGSLGQGKWSGRLAPGTHQVRVFRPGEAMRTLQIVVVAGKSYHVTQLKNGELETDAPLLGDGTPDKPAAAAASTAELEPLAAPNTGWHIQASSAILIAVHATETDTSIWTADRLPTGVGLGIRGGYRPIDWLGFELLADYGVTWGDGMAAERGSATGQTADYTLHSWRLLGGLRALAPAAEDVRFVAFAGTGVAYSSILWSAGDVAQSLTSRFADAAGLDYAVAIDLGIELDFSGILLDILLQNVLQTSRGLKPKGATEGPFGDRVMWFVGPAIRPGYEFF
jgi:hypothetical protein